MGKRIIQHIKTLWLVLVIALLSFSICKGDDLLVPLRIHENELLRGGETVCDDQCSNYYFTTSSDDCLHFTKYWEGDCTYEAIEDQCPVSYNSLAHYSSDYVRTSTYYADPTDFRYCRFSGTNRHCPSFGSEYVGGSLLIGTWECD